MIPCLRLNLLILKARDIGSSTLGQYISEALICVGWSTAWARRVRSSTQPLGDWAQSPLGLRVLALHLSSWPSGKDREMEESVLCEITDWLPLTFHGNN